MAGEEYMFEAPIAPRKLNEPDIDRLKYLSTLLGIWPAEQRPQILPDQSVDREAGSFVVSFGVEDITNSQPHALLESGLSYLYYAADSVRDPSLKPEITRIKAWPIGLLFLDIDYVELERRKIDLTDILLARELDK